MSQTWNHCLAQLKGQISGKDLATWVTPLHPVHRGNTLKLLAPNRYVQDHVKKNLFSLIEETLLALDEGVNSVKIEIGGHVSVSSAQSESLENSDAHASSASNGTSENTPNSQFSSPFQPSSNSQNGGHTHQQSPPKPYTGGTMSAAYTFEKHIEGNSNQLARAAAMQVGKNPGRANGTNPLFIYGDVGLGKTHLMQAAGHLMLQTNPQAKVLYVRSEYFVNDMVTALRSNAMPRFKNYYRSQSALLIDDIQFFARKTASQEEFFHTFNTLLDGQRQVIITSDRIPKAITDVDERLISRFSNGLAIGIEPPELETRVAILEKTAQEQDIELPEDVAFFVANAVRTNVRELQGALNSILARHRFIKGDLDVDLAREALQNLLAQQAKQLNLENIQRIVAEYFSLKLSDLTSKVRSQHIARPRQFAMYFTKEYTDLSLPKIGERFGGRDHTTVLHSCRRVQELLKTDAKTKEDHRNLQRLLGV